MRYYAKTLRITLKLLLVLMTAFCIVACSNAKQESNDLEITTSAGTHRPDWADEATTFRISVSNEDDGSSVTTVEVFEGSVDTTIEGKEITVNEGESLTIDGTNLTEGSLDFDSLPENTKDKLNEFTAGSGAD